MREMIGGFSGQKGKLLVFAGVLALAGFLMNSGERVVPQTSSVTRSVEKKTVNSKWRDQPSSSGGAAARGITWGDAAVRFGLSFGIAMIAGSLLRAFFKTMIALISVAAIVTAFLYYHDLIEPFWENYYSSAGDAKDWAAAQKDTVKNFLKGYVPSAGAGLVGFGFGLRK